MNVISDKLKRLLLSMGLSLQDWQLNSEREGWDLVFAMRHPDIWYRRAQGTPYPAARRSSRERSRQPDDTVTTQ